MARGSCVCFSPIPHAPQPPSGAAPRFSDSQRVRLRLSRSSGSAVVTDESWREEAGVRKGREESAVRGSTLRAVPPPPTCVGGGRRGEVGRQPEHQGDFCFSSLVPGRGQLPSICGLFLWEGNQYFLSRQRELGSHLHGVAQGSLCFPNTENGNVALICPKRGGPWDGTSPRREVPSQRSGKPVSEVGGGSWGPPWTLLRVIPTALEEGRWKSGTGRTQHNSRGRHSRDRCVVVASLGGAVCSAHSRT